MSKRIRELSISEDGRVQEADKAPSSQEEHSLDVTQDDAIINIAYRAQCACSYDVADSVAAVQFTKLKW